MTCFLWGVRLAPARSKALTDQVTGALPLQPCGASLSQDSDLILQTVHHQPWVVRSRTWPPRWADRALGLLALVLGMAGREVVCPGSCGGSCSAVVLFSLRFLAAASAALALDAWVSLVGSLGCWFASTVALAIHLALSVVRTLCASISCLMR